MARRNKSTLDDELIDKLLEGREHSAALLGSDGLIGELKKRLADHSPQSSDAARNYAYTTSPEHRILGLTESTAAGATATWGYRGNGVSSRIAAPRATNTTPAI